MRNVLMLGMLLAILIAAVAFAYFGLTVGDVDIGTHGRMAMTLGIFFSLLVGCGLMALVFYSSRRGYDEPPEFTEKKKSWPE